MMKSHSLSAVFLCIFFVSSSLLGSGADEGWNDHHDHQNRDPRSHPPHQSKPKQLFVFGDSYVDAGNIANFVNSQRFPYGISYPGKPTGRFSDGRVSSDYFAKSLGMKSAVAYMRKDSVSKERIQHGMNFAFGSTGVFDTMFFLPNMTSQINYFGQLLHDGVFLPSQSSSIALVSIAGNDYGTYMSRNGSTDHQSLQAFMKKLIDLTAKDLKRIHELGVKKVVVAAMEPLGCLPMATKVSGYTKCEGSFNLMAKAHNKLLQRAVAKLNKETKPDTFLILDLYSAFMTVFKNKGPSPGSKRFRWPLAPCCIGVNEKSGCGSEENGVKMYNLCGYPESAFFWDDLHPSQSGWRAVYSVLRTTPTLKLLRKLFL